MRDGYRIAKKKNLLLLVRGNFEIFATLTREKVKHLTSRDPRNSCRYLEVPVAIGKSDVSVKFMIYARDSPEGDVGTKSSRRSLRVIRVYSSSRYLASSLET